MTVNSTSPASAETAATAAATVVTSRSTISVAPSTPPTVGTGDVEGFDTAVVEIGERALLVALADVVSLRRRGLMAVEDLGSLDGMLFVMDDVVQTGFTMRDTLIPLDIAFFDGDGVVVDILEMEPCTGEPCPTYFPAGRYRYAIEVPLGSFSDLERGDRLVIKA